MDAINTTQLIGLAGIPGQGNYFELVLDIYRDNIYQSRYRCHPCAIANYIGRSLVARLSNMPIHQVMIRLPDWYQQIKESIPKHKLRVLGLAVEALAAACEQLPHSSLGDSGPKENINA